MNEIVKYLSEDIFPCLVIKFPNFLNLLQCDKIISFYEHHTSLKQHGYFTGNAKVSHAIDSNIILELEKNIDCNIEKNINNALKLYSDLTGFCETILTNSWINFQYEGSSLYDHTHPNSMITGCIYLKTDKESNPLCFQNPNPFVEYTDSFKETIYSKRVYEFYPSIGDLFIFPSWIKHGSNGKQNISKRVSIAFNTRVKQ
jgi:uncharacterized protein (TIGR02466 family)